MTQPPETVVKTLHMLKAQRELIEDQLFDISIHMPGGMSLEETYFLSFKQRKKLVKKINKYYETQAGKRSSDYIVKDGEAGVAPGQAPQTQESHVKDRV